MTQQGTIVFMHTNIGSKSEGIMPFLYVGKGKFLEIWMSKDESLSGDMLVPYDGQQITAHGEINEYDIFLIEAIETAQPVEALAPADSTESTEPTDPAESTEPIEDTEPVDSENNNTATEE